MWLVCGRGVMRQKRTDRMCAAQFYQEDAW